MEEIPLREHIVALLAELDRRHEVRLRSIEDSVAKSERLVEDRFHAVNEFRKAYTDLIGGQMPRPEFESRHCQLEVKVDETRKMIETLRQELSNQRSRSAGIAAALTIAVVVVTALVLVIRFTAGV